MPRPHSTPAVRAIIAMVRRQQPAGRRREWAALAIEAARRGGLPAPELDALRTWFRLQRQVDGEDAAKGG